jgi:hypothetical protein
MTTVSQRKGITRYLSCFICRATLSFLTVCNRCFPCRGRAKPPEPNKELSEKQAVNNPRPPNTIRKLDPAPRSPCRAIPFRSSIPGLAFFCRILHELRIHALSGVGAAHFPATPARGQKRHLSISGRGGASWACRRRMPHSRLLLYLRHQNASPAATGPRLPACAMGPEN